MQRPGGRTRKTRDSVLSAAYDVVADHGYEGLTVDAVAERSGVHKTTIYRRWETVEDVLFDAAVAQAEKAIPLQRTNDARSDLVAMATSVAANLADPLVQAVAAATLSGPGNDRLAELSQRFWRLRIAEASLIVEDAQREGSVDPSRKPGDVVEHIVGPIWFRSMVLRQSVDDDFVAELVYALV